MNHCDSSTVYDARPPEEEDFNEIAVPVLMQLSV